MNITSLVWIDSAGYHYADYPTFLLWVQTQYQNIYGADVYLGADSMDGQWTAILAQALYDTAALGAQVYANQSPATAMGAGLSQVVQINGLQREIPTNSTVILTIVGVAGTVITNGIAVDSLNQQWLLPSSVTIPGGGSINVTATAQNAGAVQAAPSTVTTIFTPTLGWQTVNNSSAATVGSPVESDAQLRIRQAASTSVPAQTTLDATYGGLSNIPGVQSVSPFENYTNTTNGNSQPPHSVCFVVDGGDLQTIANTIMLYKTPGTQTWAPAGAGYQAVSVVDPQGLPLTIEFYSPPDQGIISVQVTLTPLTNWSINTVALIQTALADFISSLTPNFTNQTGATIIVTQLYAVAYLPGTPQYGTFNITNLEIELNSGGFGTTNITLPFTSIPVCTTSDVSVTT
jgi:uncharacterized phage protein gp47/JayE